MVARTLGMAHGDAAIWTVRCAGLGSGLAVVVGAVVLGWLAWPALIGGLLGGVALIAFLAMNERAGIPSRGAERLAGRGIREQVSGTHDDLGPRIAA